MHAESIPARTESTTPLSEQAFLRLRRDLLCGELPPDTRLKLDELQTRYGLSSSPLREALSRLAQEGLVRSDERRGFRAAPLSGTDLAELTALRLLIDPPALADAIARGDDAWEAAIVAAYHRLERLESRLPEGPVVLDDDWSALHRTFHASLLAACGSERQRRLSASLFDQAERYRRVAARHRRQPRLKGLEHRRLMEAALARDAALACERLAAHIRSTERNVEAALLALAAPRAR